MSVSSAIRILFIGDMHLGCLPSGLPEFMPDQRFLTAGELGPAAAWQKAVDFAIKEKVHAVALAGDLVDSGNDVFEAFGLLEPGVKRLSDQNIDICAVAGNHDTETLPRLVGLIEKFHLLGPDGTWSDYIVTGNDGARVRLTGWSFPTSHHETSPLAQTRPVVDQNIPTLGLLHCDLNVARSSYAPVHAANLIDCNFAGWFLGHIHKPDPMPKDGQPFYLGSLTGLDPSERGQHGPVLVSLDINGIVTECKRIPLAPLRWENLDVDCSDIADPEKELVHRLLASIDRLALNLEKELLTTKALGLRIFLVGQVTDSIALENARRNLDMSQLVTSRGDTALFVQRVTSEFQQKTDLLALAKGDDPPGLLARQILILEDSNRPVPGVDDPVAESEALLQEAVRKIQSVDGNADFYPLEQTEKKPDTEFIRKALISTGRLALAHLVLGKGDSGATQ